ncbi:MAG: hypothetical protein R3C19_25825 [Planctomycetaceae bacterium]
MSTVSAELQSLRCPTCGAEQAASPECRRCRCDLTLVLAIRRQAQRLHEDALRNLRDGLFDAAVHCAERRQAVSPDRTSRRLLAVSYLASGNFAAAMAVSRGDF